ncbi:MAG: hypothetical protein IJ418_21970 [Clostridia bacterium]|nr:hypothetical protein [Clostridia bacterium]
MRPIDADALIEKLDNINPVDYGAMSSYETHNGARDALSDAVMHVNDMPTLSLNTLRDAIYQDAVAHGLWDDVNDYIGAQVHVVVEEVKELIDAAADLSAAKYRGEDIEQYRQHFIEELADVVISSLSLAGKQEVDIDAAVHWKMEINKTRPYKHEGEK